MARLSKKLKREWALFINPKTGRRTYNDLCRKCRNDCKQSFRAIVVNCPLDKRITDIQFKIKRLTERIFDDFGTFSIQKNGCCNYHFHSPFKTIQPAGNRINI